MFPSRLGGAPSDLYSLLWGQPGSPGRAAFLAAELSKLNCRLILFRWQFTARYCFASGLVNDSLGELVRVEPLA